jgi:hypothetical protein
MNLNDPRPHDPSDAPSRHGVATSRHSLVRQLHAEWARLRHRLPALRRARAWGLPVERFESLDDLLAALAPIGGDHDDPLLGALVGRAGDDELAARIVLQRLLPGLCASARRHARTREEKLLFTNELIAAAWPVIRNAGPSLGTRFLLAKLVNQCEYRVFRQHHRRRLVFEPTDGTAFELVSVQSHPDSLTEVIDLVAEAKRDGTLDDTDVEFVAALLSASTAREAAKRLKVSPRTVRNRREIVAYRLRAALAA